MAPWVAAASRGAMAPQRGCRGSAVPSGAQRRSSTRVRPLCGVLLLLLLLLQLELQPLLRPGASLDTRFRAPTDAGGTETRPPRRRRERGLTFPTPAASRADGLPWVGVALSLQGSRRLANLRKEGRRRRGGGPGGRLARRGGGHMPHVAAHRADIPVGRRTSQGNVQGSGKLHGGGVRRCGAWDREGGAGVENGRIQSRMGNDCSPQNLRI